MNTRLQQFLAAENISQASFADSLNVARAGISHILAGRNKPSYDFLAALMNRYPRLNIEWLMFGKGKMYKEEISIPQRDELFQEDLFSPQEELSAADTDSHGNITLLSESDTPDKHAENADRQRKVKKIIILFDDNTYQEL